MTWSQYFELEWMRFLAALAIFGVSIAALVIWWGLTATNQTVRSLLGRIAKRRRGKLAIRRQGYPLRLVPEELTCLRCKDERWCPNAWDAYNTNGDCLEEK